MSVLPARFLPLGNLLAFSPLGLSFVDDYTGDGPIGFITPTLEVESLTAPNTWLATDTRGLFTPSGILAYPNLGRRGRAPTPTPLRNYRVTIDAQYYDPLYSDAQYIPSATPNSDGIIFVVTPFDDNTDFTTLKATMVTLPLLPKSNYPFGGNAAFLKGQVRGASGVPVAALMMAVERYDDTASDTRQTRLKSDAGGAFRLPLRWGFKDTSATVTALDPVSRNSGTISVAYPYPFTTPQTITIPNL